jgi:hypothetical protein
VDGQLRLGAPPLPPGAPAGPTGSGPGTASNVSSSGSTAEDEADEEAALAETVPTKLVASTMRVQFTCEFRELNLGGRADLKALKMVVSKMTPARLVVLRGSEADCSSLLSFAKTNHIEGFAPATRSSVAFEVRSEKLRVQVPSGLLPSAMRPIRVFQSTTGSVAESKCSVVALRGLLEESRISGEEGTKLIKYQGVQGPAADASGAMDESKGGEGSAVEVVGGEPGMQVDGDAEGVPVMQQKVTLADSSIGVVSVGEVTLNSLKLLIEAAGTPVENKIDARGALLVCGDQVVVRKERLGDFAIEGPPVPAFYEARKALYQQFAFV